jgi:hypothetical protein
MRRELNLESPECEAGDMRIRQRRSIQEPAYELIKNYR